MAEISRPWLARHRIDYRGEASHRGEAVDIRLAMATLQSASSWPASNQRLGLQLWRNPSIPASVMTAASLGISSMT